MTIIHCPYNTPARALRHVFLAGAGTAVASLTPRQLHRSATPAVASSSFSAPTFSSPSHSSSSSLRHLSTTPIPRRLNLNYRARRPHNQQIQYKFVRVREEDGSLGPVERTDDVLDDLDLTKWRLDLVAEPPAPDPDAALAAPAAAICTLVDLSVENRRAEEAARKQRRKALGSKELEISWAIDRGDLAHKSRRLREFLAKGMSVEVVLAKKKGGRRATPKEAEELIQNLRDAAAEVPGAKENRQKFSGEIGGVCRMFFTADIPKAKK